jgi:hypothetical protein
VPKPPALAGDLWTRLRQQLQQQQEVRGAQAVAVLRQGEDTLPGDPRRAERDLHRAQLRDGRAYINETMITVD